MIARRVSEGFFRLPRLRVGLPQTFVGSVCIHRSRSLALNPMLTPNLAPNRSRPSFAKEGVNIDLLADADIDAIGH